MESQPKKVESKKLELKEKAVSKVESEKTEGKAKPAEKVKRETNLLICMMILHAINMF